MTSSATGPGAQGDVHLLSRSRARRAPRPSGAGRAPPARPVPAPGSAPARARRPAGAARPERSVQADPGRIQRLAAGARRPPPDLLGGARPAGWPGASTSRRGKGGGARSTCCSVALPKVFTERAVAVRVPGRHQHRHPHLARAVGDHRAEVCGRPPAPSPGRPGRCGTPGWRAPAAAGPAAQRRPSRPAAGGAGSSATSMRHLGEAARRAARSGPGSCVARGRRGTSGPILPDAGQQPRAAPAAAGAPATAQPDLDRVTDADDRAGIRAPPAPGRGLPAAAGGQRRRRARRSASGRQPPAADRRGHGFHRSSFSLSSTGAGGCRRITDSTVLRRPAMSSACDRHRVVADRQRHRAPKLPSSPTGTGVAVDLHPAWRAGSCRAPPGAAGPRRLGPEHRQQQLGRDRLGLGRAARPPAAMLSCPAGTVTLLPLGLEAHLARGGGHVHPALRAPSTPPSGPAPRCASRSRWPPISTVSLGSGTAADTLPPREQVEAGGRLASSASRMSHAAADLDLRAAPAQQRLRDSG